MKKLLPIFLASTAFAQYNIDSGWINNNPTLRSANEFGLNIHNSFEQFRPQNKYLKPASYFIEYLVSDVIKTNIHELGHAKQVQYSGGKPLYGEKYKNWWEYTIKRNPLKEAFVSHSMENIFISMSGINATTNFSEQNQGKIKTLWDIPNKFSGTIYILLAFNAGDDFTDSDIDKIKEFWNYKYSEKHIIASELLCFGLSQISDIKFYSYLNERGISIRARQNGKNFDWAIEGSPYNYELFFSPNLKYNKIKIKPEIIIGKRGIGYNISVNYKIFTIGYRNPNINTFSGRRELNKELYFQFKL